MRSWANRRPSRIHPRPQARRSSSHARVPTREKNSTVYLSLRTGGAPRHRRSRNGATAHLAAQSILINPSACPPHYSLPRTPTPSLPAGRYHCPAPIPLLIYIEHLSSPGPPFVPRFILPLHRGCSAAQLLSCWPNLPGQARPSTRPPTSQPRRNLSCISFSSTPAEAPAIGPSPVARGEQGGACVP